MTSHSAIRMKKIVLATDGSTDAANAARIATDLSRRTGAELHIAHAWQRHAHALVYPNLVWDDYSGPYERKARRLIQAQEDEIQGAGGNVAEPHLLEGPPIDAVLDLCDEIRPWLLITGSRGLGPVGRIFVGSVCEGIVHHASCPVLAVRGGEEAWPPERIVIGDDGSESAGLAAEMAAEIGALFDAEDILVRAYRNPPEPIGGWSAEHRRRLDGSRSIQAEQLKGRAEALGRTAGSLPEVRLVDADAAFALLRVAEEGDPRKTLLAVGSRGLGVMGRMRLGSVSTNVLRAAKGPVLVYSNPR